MAIQVSAVCSTSGRELLASCPTQQHHNILCSSRFASYRNRGRTLTTVLTQAASRQILPQPRPVRQSRQRLKPRNTYPEPETEKERSSVDYPQEWITPQPSRRPDVLPEFERLETPPPRKMPGDPEQPDEEEEEEKEKERPEEEPEEQPEQPPSEE